MGATDGDFTSADKFLRVKGFQVQFTGPDVQAPAPDKTNPDADWTTISGGADVVEVSESTTGNMPYRVFTPAHATVSPLVMEGYVTKARTAVYTWMESTRTGKNPRCDITIIPFYIDQSPAKHHQYHDCLLKEYVYPELHAHGHDMCKEKITVQPEWHEIT